SMMSFISASLAMGFDRFQNVNLGKGDMEKFRHSFSVSIGIQLMVGLVCVLLAESLGVWFLNTHMTIPDERLFAANVVFQVSVIDFSLCLLKAPMVAIVISHEKMSFYAIISIFVSFSKLLISLSLAFFKVDKLIIYSLLIFAIDMTVLLSYYNFIKKIDRKISVKPSFERSTIREIASFSTWNMIGTLAHSLKENGLNVVLNIFFGPAVNAARGIAYQVSGSIEGLYSNFQVAARPQIIKSYANGQLLEMTSILYRVSRISFMLLWIPSFLVLFSTNFILSLWLGNNYPEYTDVFIRIVIVISLIGVFGMPLLAVVHATGKIKKFQLATSTMSILILPVAYIVLKITGRPEYAFYVTLLFSIIIFLVRLVIIRRIVSFSITQYFIKVLFPCVAVVALSLPFAFIILSNITNGWIRLFLCLLVAIIDVFVFGVDKEERRMLIKNIPLHHNQSNFRNTII
ncbi:MAG: hypothetical protein IKI57_02720, partial [Clostridia bacterium]|nr:hypothetical protein [Clostridia bacterium]